MKRSVFPKSMAVAVLAAGAGVTACGGNPYGQGTPPATASATPSATSASAPATASSSGSIAGIPFYRPATIVSQTAGSAVLTSPDPVTKVTGYYVRVVDAGGWTTVSKSITSDSGNLTIRKSGRGATISIAPSHPGSLISISTYTAG